MSIDILTVEENPVIDSFRSKVCLNISGLSMNYTILEKTLDELAILSDEYSSAVWHTCFNKNFTLVNVFLKACWLDLHKLLLLKFIKIFHFVVSWELESAKLIAEFYCLAIVEAIITILIDIFVPADIIQVFV